MSRLLKLRRCCVHLAARDAQREPLAPPHTKLVFCDQSIEWTLSWLTKYRRLTIRYERRGVTKPTALERRLYKPLSASKPLRRNLFLRSAP